MALGALLALPALAGEVKLEIRPDGTKVLINEPGESRSRRLAARLVQPPDGEMLAAIESHASDQELDPRLVQAVVQVESGYNPRALSNKGAMGLMQLMPGTAAELAVENPWDIEQNLRGGTSYLRRMLDHIGDLELALAAYNAGPGAVDRHGEQVPPYKETRDYVRRIASVTEIQVGPRRVIYKIVEIIDGREVPRYSDRKPAGSYKVITRR